MVIKYLIMQQLQIKLYTEGMMIQTLVEGNERFP